jgi:acetylornithine deacetylase/succinyl-diaminopimelate desuccinylase-like protein
MNGSDATRTQELVDEAAALLVRLCSQPSVAAQHHGTAEMADLIDALLVERGFKTRRFSAPSVPDMVYGEICGSGENPFTLLLYNHYDVQPPEPIDLWLSPPFEPTVRDGNLYARGSSDNKGEIATRLTAIRTLLAERGGELPLTIRWIIEGEEEIGSPHFEELIAPHAELLQADGCFWEGSGVGQGGVPTLSLGSKGLLYVQLDLEEMASDAHSGNATILPSAAWRMVNALATLRSPSGHVTIPGFYEAVREPSVAQLAVLADRRDNDDLLKEAFGVQRFNDGLSGFDLRKRAAFAPTCNIAGLSSGYTGEGTKTVLPARAMAKLDFRLVPDQDPTDILDRLKAHLEAEGYGDISVTTWAICEPVVTPIEDPFVQRVMTLAESYLGGEKAEITPISGGTLPLLGALRRVVGVPGLSAPGNPTYWANRAHAPNEHIRLEDLGTAILLSRHVFAGLGH